MPTRKREEIGEYFVSGDWVCMKIPRGFLEIQRHGREVKRAQCKPLEKSKRTRVVQNHFVFKSHRKKTKAIPLSGFINQIFCCSDHFAHTNHRKRRRRRRRMEDSRLVVFVVFDVRVFAVVRVSWRRVMGMDVARCGSPLPSEVVCFVCGGAVAWCVWSKVYYPLVWSG